MNLFHVGAAIIGLALMLNFVFYLFRARQRAAIVRPLAALMKRSQSGFDTALMLLMVGVVATCFAAGIVAPASALGRAMADPFALACVFAWSCAAAIAISTVAALLRARRVTKIR